MDNKNINGRVLIPIDPFFATEKERWDVITFASPLTDLNHAVKQLCAAAFSGAVKKPEARTYIISKGEDYRTSSVDILFTGKNEELDACLKKGINEFLEKCIHLLLSGVNVIGIAGARKNGNPLCVKLIYANPNLCQVALQIKAVDENDIHSAKMEADYILDMIHQWEKRMPGIQQARVINNPSTIMDLDEAIMWLIAIGSDNILCNADVKVPDIQNAEKYDVATPDLFHVNRDEKLCEAFHEGVDKFSDECKKRLNCGTSVIGISGKTKDGRAAAMKIFRASEDGKYQGIITLSLYDGEGNEEAGTDMDRFIKSIETEKDRLFANCE